MSISLTQVLEAAGLAAFFSFYVLAWQAGERLREVGRAARPPPGHSRPLAPGALYACRGVRFDPIPLAVPTPLYAALSALTLLAIVLPIALAAGAVLYARRHWRSWVVYTPPPSDPVAPDAGRSDTDRRGPTPRDRSADAAEARHGRHRSRGLPAHGRAPGPAVSPTSAGWPRPTSA